MPRLCIGLICVLLAYGGVAAADDRGQEIFAERDAMDQGWGDSMVEMKMELRSTGGRSVTRRVRVRSLEGTGGEGDMTLLVFDAPADVAGTVLLTHDSLQPDESKQWLYLPAYKRVKRIASRNRSGRFMGTEFSYEDLLGDPLEDFSYRYLGDVEYQGRQVHHVERIPLSGYSAYSRQETWVDPDRLQVIKAVLYDRDGQVEKIFEASDWRLYKGRHWRAHTIVMTHVQSGRSTLLTASDYALGTGLRESDFRPAALSRVR